MIPTPRVWTRDEMMERVAIFADQRGSFGGLPESHLPQCEKELMNIIGFQPPTEEGVFSPVGSDSASASAIDIYEGFNMGFVRCRPGKGPLNHNHDTNETFIPMTGAWRCSWNEGDDQEHIDVGPYDVVSFPPGVARRFECIETPEGEETALLQFVVAGASPQADYTDTSLQTLAEQPVPFDVDALVSVEDQTVPAGTHEIPVRVYRGSSAPTAIIPFFHGGGWQGGSIDSYEAVIRRLAAATGATVVSVEHRLAPEHTFPAAVDDAVAVLTWVDGNRSELAGADASIVVSGDSSGGNMASALTLLSRDELGVDIAAQVLVYPFVDGNLDDPALVAFQPPKQTKAGLVFVCEQYVPNVEDRTDPRYSPTNASSHADLPPTLILTAEFDLLRDQAEVYASKLEAAGVATTTVMTKDATHGFFLDRAGSPQSNDAILAIASFISELS